MSRFFRLGDYFRYTLFVINLFLKLCIPTF
jgi:hypothetical protein